MHSTGCPEFHTPWRPAARWTRAQLPERLRAWLLDPASLTQRIVCACRGAFRVNVLNQSWRRPLKSEVQVLGLGGGRHALVRQVQLLCDGTPWVYARTVIPGATLSGEERRLARLRARSLGAVLFSDPSMRRGETEIARLVPGSLLFALASRGLDVQSSEIWGRRATFRLSDKPLLVTEIFSPGIGELANGASLPRSPRLPDEVEGPGTGMSRSGTRLGPIGDFPAR
jgi:chorismate--pyruvate lyase